MRVPNFSKLIFLNIFFILIASCNADGQDKKSQSPVKKAKISLPLKISDDRFEPLRSLEDSLFQAKLEAKIRSNPKLSALVNNKKISIGLVDLRDTSNVKYAQINGDNIMYAASLPKIAILLTVVEAIEKGEIKETESIRSDLSLMISKSNNSAATRMIDLVGFEKIESTLTDPKYALYDEEFGGGLWVGKRYAAAGKRYPEHIKGISHAATATQVCRFYYMLVYGKLVSYEGSKEMLGYLVDPKLHHKFINTIEKRAPNAKLYRKSGSWKNFHSDSVLVWGPKRRYILVALVDDDNGEQLLRQLAGEIDNLLKK